MRIYTVETRRITTGRARLAATDIAEAERLARRFLRPGEKLLRVTSTDTRSTGISGTEALAFILVHEYLPLADRPATVADWLIAARSDPAANARLATIGLRVLGDRLCVGSATAVPTLDAWLEGTPWAGRGLIGALGALPEASISVRSFDGRCSKAVLLPMATALAALPERHPLRRIA